LPPGITPFEAKSHTWFFDGNEHVDPQKEANAQATRLANHTTTMAHEYARQGRDWESELRQRAKELQLMTELGLPSASVQSTVKEEKETDDVDELAEVS
jgi:capsid protein